jgi:P-type Ca2+ transporter type 2B
MDSLGALALATELPKQELLERMPQNKDDYIVSRKMIKHILTQAIYQSIVLFIFLFAGEYLIPESDPTLQFDRQTGFVFPGRAKDWHGVALYTPKMEMQNGSSRHFTFIFTAFVLMQIFNMICWRKVHDEWNVFADLHTNITFIILWLVIIGGQVLITSFGSHVFSCCPKGLDGTQWAIAFGIGLSTFIVNAALKVFPDWLFPKLGRDSVDDRRRSAALIKRSEETR